MCMKQFTLPENLFPSTSGQPPAGVDSLMCFLCLVVCVACPPPVSSPEHCVGFLPGFTPLSQDSVQQMMSGLMWFTVAGNSEALSFMLLQFNVMILGFLLVGMLNTLLLLFLLLLLLYFDVSMLAELLLFGLLAFSGLKVFEVIDSNVMLCVRGS